jgi:antitoxin component YwqK of YwqJK toxin-antitoxin module
MKKGLLFLLLLQTLISCTKYKENGQNNELFCLSVIDQNGFSETISSKERLENYKNINFLSPQPYQKVMQVYAKDDAGTSKSIITSYYPNGSIKQYLEAKSNRAFGKYQEWFSDGSLKIQAYVIGGIADLGFEAEKSFIFDGSCKAYNQEGQIIADINYKKGDLDGYGSYFFENGGLHKKIFYKNNIIDDDYLEFDIEGNLLEKCLYKSGKKEGLSLTYYANGSLKSREYFKDGLIQEAFYYFENQEIAANIINGSGYRAVTQKNTLLEMHEVKEGKEEGLVEIYNKEGFIERQFSIRNDLKDGLETVFITLHPECKTQKILSINWKEGCIEGKVTSWYQSGNVESEKEIWDNKKNGKLIVWYKNGQLMMIEDYCQDLLIEGSYYKIDNFQPISKVVNGTGIATIYREDGTFLRKIHYQDSKVAS